jgi:hypothetical protein
LYDVYGDSWRVNKENSLFDYFGTETLEGFVDRNFPRSLITLERLREQLGDIEYQRIVELCRTYVTNGARLNACIIDVALTNEEDGLSAYQRIATPAATLELPTPPLPSFSSPAPGAILSSNVLIQGKVDSISDIVEISLTINDNPAENISASLSGKTFLLTRSANVFVEGSNSIVVHATDVDGNTGNAAISFVFDSSIAPPPGSDLIVINDVNLFGDDRIEKPGNIQFVKNLANFSADSERASKTKIAWDLSHSSKCDSQCRSSDIGIDNINQIWADIGYTTYNIETKEELINLDQNTKLVILLTPMEDYSSAEINKLKTFASEGGRILFIGENEDYYGSGIDVENNFLTSMGALMRNIGQAVYGGTTTFEISDENNHQVIDGVGNVSVNYVSLLELGPNDYPLITSSNGRDIIAGVARIDVNNTPVTSDFRMNQTTRIDSASKKRWSPIIFTDPGK